MYITSPEKAFAVLVQDLYQLGLYDPSKSIENNLFQTFEFLYTWFLFFPISPPYEVRSNPYYVQSIKFFHFVRNYLDLDRFTSPRDKLIDVLSAEDIRSLQQRFPYLFPDQDLVDIQNPIFNIWEFNKASIEFVLMFIDSGNYENFYCSVPYVKHIQEFTNKELHRDRNQRITINKLFVFTFVIVMFAIFMNDITIFYKIREIYELASNTQQKLCTERDKDATLKSFIRSLNILLFGLDLNDTEGLGRNGQRVEFSHIVHAPTKTRESGIYQTKPSDTFPVPIIAPEYYSPFSGYILLLIEHLRYHFAYLGLSPFIGIEEENQNIFAIKAIFERAFGVKLFDIISFIDSNGESDKPVFLTQFLERLFGVNLGNLKAKLKYKTPNKVNRISDSTLNLIKNSYSSIPEIDRSEYEIFRGTEIPDFDLIGVLNNIGPITDINHFFSDYVMVFYAYLDASLRSCNYKVEIVFNYLCQEIEIRYGNNDHYRDIKTKLKHKARILVFCRYYLTLIVDLLDLHFQRNINESAIDEMYEPTDNQIYKQVRKCVEQMLNVNHGDSDFEVNPVVFFIFFIKSLIFAFDVSVDFKIKVLEYLLHVLNDLIKDPYYRNQASILSILYRFLDIVNSSIIFLIQQSNSNVLSFEEFINLLKIGES